MGLQVQLARHASLGKARVDLAAVGVVGRQAHKRLVCKVLHLQHGLRRQRVPGGQHGHLVQRQQRHGLHTGGRGGLFAQAQVKALGTHPFFQQR